jgi:hypothetical protein
MNHNTALSRGLTLRAVRGTHVAPHNARKNIDVTASFGCADFRLPNVNHIDKARPQLLPAPDATRFIVIRGLRPAHPSVRANRFLAKRMGCGVKPRSRARATMHKKTAGLPPPFRLFDFCVVAISAGVAARSAGTGWPAPARKPRSTGGSTAPGCWPPPRSGRPASGWTSRSAARRSGSC